MVSDVQRSYAVSDSFLDKSLIQFLNELASSAPVPGGGSTAALTGALAAALVSMVGNLTIGKRRYADVEADVKALLDQSEALRHRLADLLEDDTQVYGSLSKAYGLPRDSEEQKAARTAAIQEALKEAEGVPMQIAEACVQMLDLCMPMAEKGNRLAVSDAGVAALLAEAGLRSAALNVLINLAYIQDREFVQREQTRLDRLLEGKAQLKEQVYDLVVERL
jgi:formiminotetrahydrofolate cyclodeaminase